MKNAPVVIEQGIAPAEGPGAVAQPQAIPTFTAPSAADIRARAAQLRDADLVEQFVAERASNSKNTQESYRGQLRRLAWFCRWQGLQSIREFRHDHWETFKSYLESPPPEHCMKRSVPVGHEAYRPFRTGLSSSSVALAQTIARTFFAWMADPSVGGIEVNPISTMKRRQQRASRTTAGVQRYFTDHEFSYIERSLASMPIDTPLQQLAKARAEWLITLGVLSGLRASEISAARRSMIQPSPVRGHFRLHILRKGGVKAELPLHTKVMEAYRDYIRHYPELAGLPDVPLVLPLRFRYKKGDPARLAGMVRRSIYAIVKGVVEAASELARSEEDSVTADKLERGSTHWLRHTFGTRLVDSGADLVSARDLLDHASVHTTSIYVHKPAEKQHADLERIC